jgi:hypothetical protein
MQVQCKADAVGGDMTNANKEITKCLAAMLGVSRKQVLLFLFCLSLFGPVSLLREHMLTASTTC